MKSLSPTKISIPQGDKTLHLDTIWILKGKNADQVDCFSSRCQCRLRDGPVITVRRNFQRTLTM
jgi:hypothetical protein